MQFWYHVVTKGIEEQVKSLNFFISSGEYLSNNGVVHSVSTRRKKLSTCTYTMMISVMKFGVEKLQNFQKK